MSTKDQDLFGNEPTLHLDGPEAATQYPHPEYRRTIERLARKQEPSALDDGPVQRMLAALLANPSVVYNRRLWKLFDPEVPPSAAEILVRTHLDIAIAELKEGSK